ncbi:unnamed protein product [Laminaria digitata]
MNGRPLYVRQQQFEKESRYRNMLRDQIEENKKRKDVERAKRDEEKRKELEELQRMQGRPAPRRQQHAQFQESPDHPLPSPGRLPPAAHPDERRNSSPPQGYDWEERAARPHAHGATPEYRPRDPHGVSGPESEGGWQGHQRAPDGTPGQGVLGQNHRPRAQPDAGASAALHDAGGGRRGFAQPTHNGASPSPHDGYGRGGCDGPAGRSGFQHGAAQPQGGQESTARTLAFERGGQRQHAGPQDMVHAGQQDVVHASQQDVVPRRDFDELSNLCRDLLLEQKRLRSKLEEREEREQRAEQVRQQESDRRQEQTRHPRETLRGGRGGVNLGGVVAAGGDRRTRASHAPSPAPRAQGKNARENTVRRDGKAKPSVAFGSTVSRLEQTRPVEKPRSAAGSNTATRGRRVPRISKSEPMPRAENLTVPRFRSLVRAEEAEVGQRRPHRHLPDIGWTASNNGSISGRSAGPDHPVGNRALPEERGGINRSDYPSSNAGSGTVHALLRGGHDPRVSGRDAGTGQGNARDGYGELGGESMFLAAHPLRSGVEEGDVNGRDGGLLDPRLAADPWHRRR